MRLTLIAFVLGLAPMAAPSQDAMAVQRCVWSCLSGTGSDPESAAYEQCVRDNCNEEPAGPDRDPTQTWQGGATSGGARFAGIDAPGRAGEAGLYVFCQPGDPATLKLVGLPGGAGAVDLDVDGQSFSLAGRTGPENWLEASLAPTAPVFAALQSGNMVEVRKADGSVRWSLSLAGSGRALGPVLAHC